MKWWYYKNYYSSLGYRSRSRVIKHNFRGTGGQEVMYRLEALRILHCITLTDIIHYSLVRECYSYRVHTQLGPVSWYTDTNFTFSGWTSMIEIWPNSFLTIQVPPNEGCASTYLSYFGRLWRGNREAGGRLINRSLNEQQPRKRSKDGKIYRSNKVELIDMSIWYRWRGIRKRRVIYFIEAVENRHFVLSFNCHYLESQNTTAKK